MTNDSIITLTAFVLSQEMISVTAYTDQILYIEKNNPKDPINLSGGVNNIFEEY